MESGARAVCSASLAVRLVTHMRRFSALVVLALSALPACRQAPSGSDQKPRDVPNARLSADVQALCLEKMDGNDKLDAALAHARTVAQKRASEIPVWIALGRLWMQKARVSQDPGFYRNVDACADAALELEPDNAAAQNLKGFVHLNDHEFRRARDLAEKILSRDAGDRLAWGTRSDALLELGDVDGAEQATQRMLDLKPDAASYGRAAHLRWLRGDLEGAKRIFAQALKASSQAADREPYAWLLVQTAQIFWHEGDVAGADAGFKLALERVPDYAPALVGRARVAIAQKRFADAVALLERAHERSPSVESAWLLANARTLMGDRRAASVAFDRAVRAGRHDPATLAFFYASRGQKLDEAVRLARRAHDERPNTYSKDILAWALYRAGKIDEASETSKSLLQWGTRDARLWFHAGAIRLAAGDRTGGRKLIARALELNAQFDPFEAEEARRLLGKNA
jgi:tetratricopeptide (TPR) repeat protein